jgi:hypothetical protein
MNNLNQPLDEPPQNNVKKTSWPLIIFLILVVVAIGFAWQFTGDKTESVIVEEPQPTVIIEPEPEPEAEPEKVVVIPVPEVTAPIVDIIEEVIVPVKVALPPLNESDGWLKLKLPEITWRKELLSLIVDEDMIRRFVVFTDNFAQGNVIYEHSPFVLPTIKFTSGADGADIQDVVENKEIEQGTQKSLQWDENSSKRFSLYVDLLRSMDSESLVKWYLEVKPLINEAYSELGYEDDFTNTLQDAITRVLDMELPKSSMALVHPSVMYKFADPELEALPDSDKLLLRLGKDNLLVIKSVLLEIHEKLAQQKNGVN